MLAPRVLAAFGRYLRLVRVNAADIPEQLPEDPHVLSHLVAATANLTIAERQTLLATEDTPTRLRKELVLLYREVGLLTGAGGAGHRGRSARAPRPQLTPRTWALPCYRFRSQASRNEGPLLSETVNKGPLLPPGPRAAAAAGSGRAGSGGPRSRPAGCT